MKRLVVLTIALTGLLTACASHHRPVVAPPPAAQPAIVTPDNSTTASVAMYDAVGRFVVLTFPVDRMPPNDQIFFIYHAGLKSGEVKITGPVRNNTIVADLISGEAQAGDEVRDK